MMFNNLPLSRFNPMRDVWLPLDLSNAVSFNLMIAHSAAHLAQMRGHRVSTEALRFKAEAMRILSIWMQDDDLALSDDGFAAISRLLSYEVSAILVAFSCKVAKILWINSSTAELKKNGRSIVMGCSE